MSAELVLHKCMNADIRTFKTFFCNVVLELHYGELNIKAYEDFFADRTREDIKKNAYDPERMNLFLDKEANESCYKEEYRLIHRTRVNKTVGIKTHVIILSEEVPPLVEETEDWYIICREDTSFDKEKGLEENLREPERYLVAKGERK